MNIKETTIETDLIDGVWNGRGWDIEIICDIEGTVWDDTLPAMGSDEAIAVIESMTSLFEWGMKKRDETKGI